MFFLPLPPFFSSMPRSFIIFSNSSSSSLFFSFLLSYFTGSASICNDWFIKQNSLTLNFLFFFFLGLFFFRRFFFLRFLQFRGYCFCYGHFFYKDFGHYKISVFILDSLLRWRHELFYLWLLFSLREWRLSNSLAFTIFFGFFIYISPVSCLLSFFLFDHSFKSICN